MKAKNLFVCSSLLAGLAVVTLGGQSANAAETYPDYTDALNATGQGSITFSGDDDNVVPSPDDPDIPVEPDKPNPHKGDLKIVYVPNFEFGTHKKNTYGMTAQSQLIKVTNAEGNKVETVPFVTTKDMRSDRGTGWVLSCTAGAFTHSTDSTKTIPAAYVSLDKAHYVGNETNAVDTLLPTVANKDSINLVTGQATPVSTATVANNPGQGLGMYSLAFGTKVAGEEGTAATTDGVTFHLPANTVVDDATYTADFVWTLAPEV